MWKKKGKISEKQKKYYEYWYKKFQRLQVYTDRDVSYILIIPKNYTNDFFKGLNPKIETLKTPDSSATFIEMLLNRYLKIIDIMVWL